jgi:hypothetical protein
MSFLTAVGNGFKKVGSFFKAIIVDGDKAVEIWEAVGSNGTKALVLQLGSDVMQLVAEGETILAGGEFNLTLDLAFVAGVKKLIADAEAGDAVVKSDLALFGISPRQ